MIRICPVCKGQFKTKDSRQIRCSYQCWHVGRQLINDGRLLELAQAGVPLADMKAEFGVSYEGVRRALVRTGFREVWRKQRFA